MIKIKTLISKPFRRIATPCQAIGGKAIGGTKGGGAPGLIPGYHCSRGNDIDERRTQVFGASTMRAYV
ncbi:MAG: hypothetical protein JXX14_10330 [Deltaproteobacteria bacterium]|nr:hypothetical protein [Deltaproteobacteria bacterium]